MGSLGKVRIGHPAPDFHCDAVVKGVIEEVTLSTYVSPARPRWLILLFIPAAFSFVCPTEVLAFQNCLDEFHDRNCDVLFISVDTKHSLWHWQNVPREYGGLGHIDIALLSDANHKMARDYGVLIEEEGVSLRGMFILDDKSVVQQATLNNLTVGRSVLEALRLLEAFQAVAKHGVLCPIDWRPSADAAETLNTISNTLTESYDERLANLQKEFGDTPITDLDAKHKTKEQKPVQLETTKERGGSTSTTGSSNTNFSGKEDGKANSSKTSSPQSSRTNSATSPKDLPQPTLECSSPSPSPSPSSPVLISTVDCLPRRSPEIGQPKSQYISESTSAPTSAGVTPTPTPATQHPPPMMHRKSVLGGTARHARGHATGPLPPRLARHNTYESRRGSHVVLEFADPISSPSASPSATPLPVSPVSHTSSPILSRTASVHQTPRTSTPRLETPPIGKAGSSPSGGNQTRLQMTFEAIKKMSAGLASPKIDFGVKRSSEDKSKKGESGNEANGEDGGPGYFDVLP